AELGTAFPEQRAGAEIGIRRKRPPALEAETVHHRMVLKVLSHAREIDDRVDAEIREVIPRPNAGQQEESRRVDCPGAQDYLARCVHRLHLTVPEEIEARAACAGKR